MNRVFVYGTLKRGQRNYRFMRGAEYMGDHRTEKLYSMYEFDDYPAVCLRGCHAIRGEVYRVSDRQFRLLDDLEWYPHYYQRIEIPTTWGDAWMYIVEFELCHGRRQIPGSWPE
ncbi:MAG: gamma-glutamylcyclotransferase [Gammaproteobacteria bacterium]|nr:gamma-glutamylcyclotransferase [Gammaproteobacteria bacterium]